MTDSNSFIDDLYSNLSALSKDSFPKHCNNCGRVFETERDFVLKTVSMEDHSGFKPDLDDDGRPLIELFRNCTCGSTLMDYFNERRDLSEKGIRRRETFEKILVMLEKKGWSRHQGRQELLKFMRGERSRYLESLGVRRKKT